MVGAFAPTIPTLLQTFAGQAVLAIENARLFQELGRRGEEARRARNAAEAALTDLRRAQDWDDAGHERHAHPQPAGDKVAEGKIVGVVEKQLGEDKIRARLPRDLRRPHVIADQVSDFRVRENLRIADNMKFSVKKRMPASHA